MLFSLPFFGSCTCWHGSVSLWSWGCGKGGGGEGRPGAILAEPHFSQSLTCRAGQCLEFPMGCVGCYLVKLDRANCAKESHQADTQHQLKEGKDHMFTRQPRDHPCPKSTRHGACSGHLCTSSVWWSPPQPVLNTWLQLFSLSYMR